MTAQLSLFCGHAYRFRWHGVLATRRCTLLPHEYGSHDDGQVSWTVGMVWPNWRRGGRR